MSDPDVNAVRLVLALARAAARGRTSCRGSCAARSRASSAAPGRRTVANAWGTLAVEKFAPRFETAPVAGTTTATLGRRDARRSTGRRRPTGARSTLPWPASGSGDLALAAARRRPRRGRRSQTRAALPLDAPLAAGYRITKTVTPVETRTAGATSRGDVLRVHLEIDAERDMTWVVVNDPCRRARRTSAPASARDSAAARGAARSGRGRSRRSSPSAPSTASAPTTTSCRRAASRVEYTVRPSQAGRFAAAADAGRGALRAGRVRRDPERAARGRAVTTPRRAGRRGRRRPARSRVAVALAALARVAATPRAVVRAVRAAHRPSDVPLLDRHGDVVARAPHRSRRAPARVDAARRRLAGARAAP